MTGQKKEKSRNIRPRFTLNLTVSALIFLLLVLTMGIISWTVSLLVHLDILSVGPQQAKLEINRIILYIALASILLGSVLSAWFGRILLRPVNQVINAMNALADGKFSTRLTFGSWFGRQSAGRELSESFNKMAGELENTEMLRSDFINNFSHEFKTPIVSIAGFASLLRRGNLDEKQKQEYLAAIEEESMRLSDLATNVLNLSKIENQTILGDKTRFNLSEQIRSCILLFERKWSEKKLDLIPDFDEYEITADREMLKQVWINLLDNAVKFTPEYGLIKITIRSRDDDIVVSFTNTGSSIPEDKRERIFQKFYQADESHATKGNGVGLAIVKKVVELHRGEVSVAGDESSTTFTVVLPDGEKTAVA